MLVDSDAFILLGASGLIELAGEAFGLGPGRIRRLHPLPFMLERGRLAKRYPAAIREKVKSWCSEIEPIRDAPSASIRERLAGTKGIDDGEELLFGLLFEKPDYLLLSNDKTAIRAVCRAPDLQDVYHRLCGRVTCLETVLKALLGTVGIKVLAEAITPVRQYNGMLNAIFSMGTDTGEDHCRDGLASYIRQLESEVGPGFLRHLLGP